MNKKNKLIIYTLLSVLLVLFIIGTAMVLGNMKAKEPPSSPTPYSSQNDVTSGVVSSEEKDRYTIKTFGSGKIGVFSGNDEQPVLVLSEIVLQTLPEFDRDLLEKGITVYSDEELYALIEDLDS